MSLICISPAGDAASGVHRYSLCNNYVYAGVLKCDSRLAESNHAIGIDFIASWIGKLCSSMAGSEKVMHGVGALGENHELELELELAGTFSFCVTKNYIYT